MKKDIHPKSHDLKIKCSCGAILETTSTQETLETEICSQCHPLYTGDKKVIDTTGRLERFKKIQEKANARKEELEKVKKEKKVKEKKANKTEKKTKAAKKEKK